MSRRAVPPPPVPQPPWQLRQDGAFSVAPTAVAADTAIKASTSPLEATACSAAVNASGPAAAPRSTGLATAAVGSTCFSSRWSESDSSGTSRSTRWAASAASTPARRCPRRPSDRRRAGAVRRAGWPPRRAPRASRRGCCRPARRAHRPGRRQGDAARRWRSVGEGSVETDRRIGVHHAEAVRANDAHAVPPGGAKQRTSARPDN